MKTHLHENGWVVIVDEDITTLSDTEIEQVARLSVSNMVVVFKNQKLTAKQELNICQTIGNVQLTSAEISILPGVIRVTGEKNSKGEEGLFGHKHALDWHANQPSSRDRKPLIWLYGEKGTSGSRTSWINNIMAYEALDDEFKAELQDIEVYCGYKKGGYSDSRYFKEHVNTDNPIKLIQTNEEGKTGLFFPFLQIFGFKDKSEDYFNETMQRLREHVLNPRFAYHHDWQDGDIVLSEQWLSIHKRWEFDQMEKRVLHRIALDHEKVYNIKHKMSYYSVTL